MSCSLYTRSSPRDLPPSPSSGTLNKFLRVVDLARRANGDVRAYLIDWARQMAIRFDLNLRIIAPDLLDDLEDEEEEEEDVDM